MAARNLANDFINRVDDSLYIAQQALRCAQEFLPVKYRLAASSAIYAVGVVRNLWKLAYKSEKG